MTDLKLGDRHSRQIDGLGMVAEPKVVELRVGHVGSSIPCQHLLACLVNLLARLHGTVRCIVLKVDGELQVALPNAQSPHNAFSAMVDLALWANGGRIPVVAFANSADIVVDIGLEPSPSASLYGWGSGWKSWVGRSPPRFDRNNDNPDCLGPYFAAALVAAEVFKLSRGLTKGRHAEDDAYSLWTGETGLWQELTDGPSVRAQSLPGFYLVGAGAVGQGVMLTLGACELSKAYVITIDHDHHDKEGTNLNRCFLAGFEDIGKPKVDAIARYRRLTRVDGYEFKGKLGDYLVSAKPGLKHDFFRTERLDQYDTVVSAVDVNTSRHDIQGLHPRLAVGGSTDGLRAQSTLYGVVEGAECLACWNGLEDDKQKAVAIEANLRSLGVEDQLIQLTGNVENLEAAISYLAVKAPKCGQLGEAEVRSFTNATLPDFSVSFVSMAAAAMTVAKLLAATVFAGPSMSLPAKSLFQFKNLNAGSTMTPRSSKCPFCGRQDRQRSLA